MKIRNVSYFDVGLSATIMRKPKVHDDNDELTDDYFLKKKMALYELQVIQLDGIKKLYLNL